MPDVRVQLVLMGRVVEAHTRNGDAGSLFPHGVRVLTGKPFPAHLQRRVEQRVRNFLANGRGDQEAVTTGGWLMSGAPRYRKSRFGYHHSKPKRGKR